MLLAPAFESYRPGSQAHTHNGPFALPGPLTGRYWIQTVTRSTATVHTSAKARLASADIWQISMNECPLTTFHISQSINQFNQPINHLVTNPENNPRIQTGIWIATKIKQLVR